MGKMLQNLLESTLAVWHHVQSKVSAWNTPAIHERSNTINSNIHTKWLKYIGTHRFIWYACELKKSLAASFFLFCSIRPLIQSVANSTEALCASVPVAIATGCSGAHLLSYSPFIRFGFFTFDYHFFFFFERGQPLLLLSVRRFFDSHTMCTDFMSWAHLYVIFATVCSVCSVFLEWHWK